jgi:PAS domain S-box-containing protein
MKLFQKILLSIIGPIIIAFSVIAFSISSHEISELKPKLLKDQGFLAQSVIKDIEKDHVTPVDLIRLSEGDHFLFWRIVRDDGTIHLADNKILLEGDFSTYLSKIDWKHVEEGFFESPDGSFGVFVKPIKMKGKQWKFIYGFSIKNTLERRTDLIIATVSVTLLIMMILTITLYVVLKHLVKPIEILSEGAEIIGNGNFMHRVKINRKDELALLADSFNKMAENLQKKTVTKQYVDTIIDTIEEMLIVTDSNKKIKKVNRATCKLLGYSSDELLEQPVDILSPESINCCSYPCCKETHEVTFIKKDGNTLLTLFSCSNIGSEGYFEGSRVCTAHDITERKHAEEKLEESLYEKEVLLQEIHHRVKNNMQIISSLLSLQSQYVKDKYALEMFKESRNRIFSMASIHEKLYHSGDLAKIDFDGYIKSLSRYLFLTYNVKRSFVNLNVDCSNVYLSIDKAVPCGLIINELLSNALKHAFPEGREGEITVDFHPNGDGTVILIVSDNGVGFPKDIDIRNARTLGLHLVSALVNQLKATLEIEKDSGTTFRITFTP